MEMKEFFNIHNKLKSLALVQPDISRHFFFKYFSWVVLFQDPKPQIFKEAMKVG